MLSKMKIKPTQVVKIYPSCCLKLRLDSRITDLLLFHHRNEDVGLDREHHKTGWTWRDLENNNRPDLNEMPKELSC